jgi:NADPH-dependent 2,4-dienoyl-CoA reductase/sulfur reductase-like enzyme
MTAEGATATDRFAGSGRAVIVGASLAGLRAAEGLRDEGFAGSLVLIGDEPHGPYDRPPLTKRVLAGRMPADHTVLPRLREVEAEWLLGVAATGLDPTEHRVALADGREVEFDRVLIATGTRARPWPNEQEGALDGVFVIRGRGDAERLVPRLDDAPRRVLVIGAGFIGSEVASVCRERGLEVTVAERGAAPLIGALGGAAGSVATRLQRSHGVDLRCNTTVMALEGDERGRLRRARLSDGDYLEADVAVVALGAVRNVEWLDGAGLAADRRGVVCDAACRAFDADGMVTDDIFVAGDVARWPHPLYDGQLLSVEHWGNAVDQARSAAHNMVCRPAERRAHRALPTFWSNQFDVNIKAVGLPTVADEVAVTHGSVEELRFVAAYGSQGRIVAAVAVNAPRWLEAYHAMIEQGAPFPPALNASDGPATLEILPAGFPSPGQATHSSSGAPTGPGPSSSEEPGREPADARVPPGSPPL